MKPLEQLACLAIQNLDERGWRDLAEQLSDNAEYLIRRSFNTPYTHLEGYMERYWLLNPYDFNAPKGTRELPSARIHHILREDHDRHFHDHPWDARFVILKGWYIEERLLADGTPQRITRRPGDTATLDFGEYHRIVEVSPGGVWTLFITYQYRGTWGFLVDGKKVPWREYLATEGGRV
jgi:hypothetical protein